MAKKQTRRSVSIRGSTYDRIRSYCENEDISMSEFVEGRISSFFEGALPPLPVAEAPKRETERPPAVAPVPEAPRRARSSEEEEEKLSFDEMQDAARIYTF